MQYQYANYSANYIYWGKGSVGFQLINQRYNFSFALFTGGLENVCDLSSDLYIFGHHVNCKIIKFFMPLDVYLVVQIKVCTVWTKKLVDT